MNINNKLLIGGGLVLVVIVALLVFGGSSLLSDGGEVVATVNGEEITRNELDLQVNQMEQNLALQGQSDQLENEDFQNQLQQQAINQVVGRYLLIQAANDQDITVSSSQVEERYNEVVSQAGGEEALQQRFAETGVTEDQLREDLRNQVLIENYIDYRKQQDPDYSEVTEQDIMNRYEELSAQSEAEAPALSDVREQIRLQIERERESEFINQLVSELRNQANVEVLL